jgi:uncharacterized membrane protein
MTSTSTTSAGRPSEPAAGPKENARSAVLDIARGVAVALMVGWHVTDGWTAEPYRAGFAWDRARGLGGLAAPLFLFAAGAALGLGAAHGRAHLRNLRRGLGLLVLGYLLRLQSWSIDRGAILDSAAWGAIALGLGAGLTAYWALRAEGRLRALGVALALFAGHLYAVHHFDPEILRVLSRFDVLHCIGLSMMACAALGLLLSRALSPTAERPRFGALAASYALAALAVSVATDALVRAVSDTGTVDLLAWLARPNEARRSALFPLFPWASYALAGLAATYALRARQARLAKLGGSPRGALLFAVLALAIGANAYEAGFPWTFRALELAPDLRNLARLVFHGAGATLVLCLAVGLAGTAVGRVTASVGRASLVIYWAHLPLAYGKLARPFRQALDPTETRLGIAAILLVATLLVLLWERLSRWLGERRARRLAEDTSDPAARTAPSA